MTAETIAPQTSSEARPLADVLDEITPALAGRAPLAVAAWLEALVKAHLAVPPPLCTIARADGQAFASPIADPAVLAPTDAVPQNFMRKGGTDATRQV